jgi:D-serine ammonia-lyase
MEAYVSTSHPVKADLLEKFRGKPLADLRTPALVIDEKLFAENCAEMCNTASAWGARLRVHVKTHKVGR